MLKKLKVADSKFFKSDYVGESKMTTTIEQFELEQSKSLDFSLIILNSILFLLC